MSEHDRYQRAGVDYGVLDAGKRLAQAAALATARELERRGIAEVTESRGESAYALDLGDRYVTTVTEALGTKCLIADLTRPITGKSHYDAIAQDTVATILNDLAVLGGNPVSLAAYWGAGTSEWFADQERMADLVNGWERACHTAGCAWGGGETQTLAGIIEPGAAVLGGSAVGLVAPKERLLSPRRIEPGDVILVAASTGLHANGATLAREIAAQAPDGYATRVPNSDHALGAALLEPTPLYGPLVEALQGDGIPLHYAVHVTGHGLRKLMRPKRDLTYRIDRMLPVPPVLDFLVAHASMDAAEAYGTFNMGFGFALYVAPDGEARARSRAAEAGFILESVGVVEPGPRRVVLAPLGVTYDAAALAI